MPAGSTAWVLGPAAARQGVCLRCVLAGTDEQGWAGGCAVRDVRAGVTQTLASGTWAWAAAYTATNDLRRPHPETRQGTQSRAAGDP